MSAGDNGVSSAQEAVFQKSKALPEGSLHIKGYDFNDGINYDNLFDSYLTTGFQASNMAMAIQVCDLYCGCISYGMM